MTGKRVDRRLAAILVGDVVGYSRLVETDEAGTLAAFKEHLNKLIEPAIKDNRGRLVKTMGDGVLAEFASAVDAVVCARTIQAGISRRNHGVPEDRRLVFRIGANVGDIVIDGDDIQGEGVNIAARLEGLCDPGGICISNSVYEQVRGKLDLGFADLGEQKVKNITRPVRAYQITDAGEVPTPTARKSTIWKKPAAMAVVTALIVVAGGLVWLRPWERVSEPKPVATSIVVLPFGNVSGDTSQDYLADAITNQLTTHLARIPGTFVIASNTAFTYKGKSVNARQIGKDLGVKFVMEGSVQPGDDRIRVNAQLVNAVTGALMWAETFDKKHTDQLQLQDEIVTRISRALHIELSAVEASRLSQPAAENVNGEALAIKCESMLIATAPAAKQMYEAGYSLCEQAIQIDPKNSRALSIMAIKHGVMVTTGASKDRPHDIQLTNDFASRALAANPKLYLAHVAQSYAFSVLGKHQEAIVAGQRANNLNPSFLGSYIIMLASGLYIGQPEKSVEWAAKVIRISPRDPLLFAYFNFLARAHFMLGQHELAINWMRKSVAANPSFPHAQAYLVAMLGAAGQEGEAKELLKTYLSRKGARSRTIAQWNRVLRTKNPKYLVSFKKLTEGLRRAGMPEN